MSKAADRKNQKKTVKSQSVSFLSNLSLKTVSITSAIVLAIVSIVLIVGFILYTYSKESLQGLQNDSWVDFISNIPLFEETLYNKQVQALQPGLNRILGKNNQIQYTVIFNKDMKEIYSTLPEGSEYDMRESMGKYIFKVRFAPGLNVNNLRTILIKQPVEHPSYYIYFGMKQSSLIQRYMNEINTFIIGFSLLILLFTIAVALMLARSISGPLLNMEKTVSKIADGDLSGRLEYSKYFEINQLVDSYNIMANALQKLYSTMEEQVRDKTRELKNAYTELQNTQAMMVHSEKMKSLGELVAGIMHEINNPINFIYGNMTHLSNYSNDLIELIEDYTKYSASLKPEEKEEIEKKKEELDYEFLKTDMPDLIKSCKEGADRAKNIIQDLKSFSRMEEVSITDVDLVHEIDMTLNILHNKLKNKAQIHKEYDEPLPKIEAFGGQLNQVFMNILDNAACAIENTGDIWIRIKKDEQGKNLHIEIEDNGIGMDEETSRKVFDPFFTTKPIGQGTGLGMSITHKIIKNHQGSITLESVKGKGTKFIITLPLSINREELQAGMSEEGEKVNG